MKDIIVENGDIVVLNGGAKVGDCELQVCEHVVSAFSGEYKEAPLLGGNVRRMLNGRPDPFWDGDVKAQMRRCGVELKRISIEDEEITVELK